MKITSVNEATKSGYFGYNMAKYTTNSPILVGGSIRTIGSSPTYLLQDNLFTDYKTIPSFNNNSTLVNSNIEVGGSKNVNFTKK